MSTSKTPCGVVAVFVGPDGREIVSVSDFSLDGYGGFSAKEAQEHRVKDAISARVIQAFCSDAVGKHIDRYRASEILREMQREDGFKLHLIPIGHDDEAAK